MAKHRLLSEVKPQLLNELISGRNTHLDLENLRVNSGIRAWWQCVNNSEHQWEAPIRNRAVAGYGCPFCSGLKTHPNESFAALHPAIAAEFHPSLNPDLNPWATAALAVYKSILSNRRSPIKTATRFSRKTCPTCGCSRRRRSWDLRAHPTYSGA